MNDFLVGLDLRFSKLKKAFSGSLLRPLLKQSRTLWSLLPQPLHVSACLLCVEKFQPKNKINQASEKMQKQKKVKETTY